MVDWGGNQNGKNQAAKPLIISKLTVQ